MNDFIAAYLERLEMSAPDRNDPAALAAHFGIVVPEEDSGV